MSAENDKAPAGAPERVVDDALIDPTTRRRLARALAKALQQLDADEQNRREWRGGKR